MVHGDTKVDYYIDNDKNNCDSNCVSNCETYCHNGGCDYPGATSVASLNECLGCFCPDPDYL